MRAERWKFETEYCGNTAGWEPWSKSSRCNKCMKAMTAQQQSQDVNPLLKRTKLNSETWKSFAMLFVGYSESWKLIAGKKSSGSFTGFCNKAASNNSLNYRLICSLLSWLIKWSIKSQKHSEKCNFPESKVMSSVFFFTAQNPKTLQLQL